MYPSVCSSVQQPPVGPSVSPSVSPSMCLSVCASVCRLCPSVSLLDSLQVSLQFSLRVSLQVGLLRLTCPPVFLSFQSSSARSERKVDATAAGDFRPDTL